jgi:cysteine desulfurase
MSEYVYLDHHSATPCLPEVLDLFSRLSKEYFGLSESYHYIGQKGVYSLQKAADQLFNAVGAKDQDRLFCFRLEESLEKIFLYIYMQVARETGKTGIFTLQGAEKAFGKIGSMGEILGCTHKILPLNSSGQLTRQIVEENISSRTALLSLPYADPLTGVIHPIEDIAALCEEKGVLLHVDASYILGKRFFRYQDLKAHFLTMDAAPLEGIVGTGLLWVKEEVSFDFEEMLPSVAQIASLSYCVQERQNKFEHYCLEVARLRDLLEKKIMEECPSALVLFQAVDRLPNCSVIAFPGIYCEALAYLLHTKGVYVSFGGGKFPKLEETLHAIGMSNIISKSAICFSLGAETTEEDIHKAVLQIAVAVRHLQRYSIEEGL